MLAATKRYDVEQYETNSPDLETERAFDPDLEVDLHVVAASPANDEAFDDDDDEDEDDLDHEWFGEFDETQPLELVEDTTTPWRRLTSWVRKIKRAA